MSIGKFQQINKNINYFQKRFDKSSVISYIEDEYKNLYKNEPNNYVSFLIKEKLMKHAKEIPWDHIKSINFGPYKIVFSMTGSDYIFSYRSTSDTSKEIKSAVREMAESKGIEVLGG